MYFGMTFGHFCQLISTPPDDTYHMSVTDCLLYTSDAADEL